MKKIFIQGDGKAEDKLSRACEKLASALSSRRYLLLLGSTGKLVQAAIEGAGTDRVYCFLKKGELGKTAFDPEKVQYADCSMLLANSKLLSNEEAWGLRLGRYLAADGFAFFPGGMGTLSHLVPVIAHIIKGDLQKGKPGRPVAMIGWSDDQMISLRRCLGLTVSQQGPMLWFRRFRLDQINDAVDFLAP